MGKCLNRVELYFFPSYIKPTEDSKVIFFEYGELKVGSYFDGRFYCDGKINFPSCWAYQPKEPNA